MKKLKVEYLKTDDLIPYAGNAKLHPAEQIAQIKKSIEDYGFNDPIAIWKNGEIIAGHGRLIAAKEMGMEEVPVVRLDGLTDQQRRAYALVHNKLTMNSGFDDGLLDIELGGIFDYDMGEYGFEFPDDDGKPEESPYTNVVKTPQYVPSGSPTDVSELVDTLKADQLVSEILGSSVPENVKSFLITAAQRHNVFDYCKIADYYAQTDEETQALMEKSALVIIDYDDAIANGYAELSSTIQELRRKDSV